MNTQKQTLGAGIPANAQHTPGPWEAAGRAIYANDRWNDGINSGGYYLAQVFSEPDRELPDIANMTAGPRLVGTDLEADANARLLAAAPDLLAALEWSHAILHMYWHAETTEEKNHYAPDVGHAVSVMHKAIARAKGGAL